MTRPIQVKENKKVAKLPAPLNAGTDTPVPDRNANVKPSASETELFRQANNPLGDPYKS